MIHKQSETIISQNRQTQRTSPGAFTLTTYILLALITLMFPNSSSAEIEGTLSLTDWHYTWEEESTTDANPLDWLSNQQSSAKWQPLKVPFNPPERNSRQVVWFKAKIPDLPNGYNLSIYPSLHATSFLG